MVVKYVYLVMALTGAVAMPVLLDNFLKAYQSWRTAEQGLVKAREEKSAADAYRSRYEAYRAYATEVDQFAKLAQEERLVRNAWTSYQIKVDNRPIPVMDLRQLLLSTRNGMHQYFKPKSVEINSITLAELEKLGNSAQDNTSNQKVDPGLGGLNQLNRKAQETFNKRKPDPGMAVFFSIEGEYLVQHQ
ncbi:MAG: hypothetical protein HQL58_03235 [Magnetococcales bacterium]|nr:hypothetical protein [Magnetococcales bacterium]